MEQFGNQSKSYLSELVRLNKYNLIAFSYQQLTVSGATAQALTIPAGTKYAEFSFESDVTATIPVRYLMLGNATLPTTTTGFPLRDGTFMDITGIPNLNNFRVIESTVGTHILNIQYYK